MGVCDGIMSGAIPKLRDLIILAAHPYVADTNRRSVPTLGLILS